MKVKNNGLPYRIGDSITKCSKMFKLFEIKNKRNAVNSTFLLLFNTAADRNRTGTGITTHGILSPGRLPIPPFRRKK